MVLNPFVKPIDISYRVGDVFKTARDHKISKTVFFLTRASYTLNKKNEIVDFWLPFFLVILLRICNNFLEFNCLQFCFLFKSVFLKDSFGSRVWLSTRWKSWFFPSSVKENKAKKKSKTRKKEKNYSIAIILQKIICVKSPVLSFTQSVSQSVKQTINQSFGWLLSWAHT